MTDLLLLPYPKKVTHGKGTFHLHTRGQILFQQASGKEDMLCAQHLRQGLPNHIKAYYKIMRATKRKDAPPQITMRRSDDIAHQQGYRLTIAAEGVLLEARTNAGLFYGAQTMAQIVRQYAFDWPVMTIEDWPDFARRGVYHDVSRGKVPKLATILRLVDDLASLKINEFQLYVENVYAFKRHPKMYDDTTPLTAKELQTIDKACRERFIDFVPSLTSLGHFEKILCQPEFRHLAEVEPEELRRAGIETWSTEPWSLCVTDPAAQRLLKDMYDEYLPNFSSQQFNICCDESWDLGKGRSKKLADKIGVGKMYVDWVKYCAGMAAKHGRKIQMWGDIILRHPELIKHLPKDATLLEWGYEANHKFDEHCKLFAKSGRPFYVAPGTSSWLALAGRTANAFGNLRNAAQAGLKYGAAGFLNTDWGDNGHQQLLPISFLPFAYGAAVCWNQAGTKDQQVIDATSLQIFRDRHGSFAQALADLGQTYERIGWQRFNGSVDWFLFREPWKTQNYINRVKPADLHKTINATREILARLQKGHLVRRDGKLIVREAVLTARTIIYAAERTLARMAMRKKPTAADRALMARLLRDNVKMTLEYHRLWLARNKPSRLQDVIYHFTWQQVELAEALNPGLRSKSKKAFRKDTLTR